jgi:GAF domain-containing protein
MKSAKGPTVGKQARLPALSRIELAVARTLAEAADAEETYNRVLAEIGTALNWELGAVWEVSTSDDLRCVAVWEASPQESLEFRSLSERMTLNSGEGLPGRVWATGKAAWIVDVVADPNFPRAQAAARAGFRAAFCFPIRSPGGIVGAMEFFTQTLHEPDEPLLSSMTVLGNLIGQFVVRRRAEDAVRKREALTGAILGAALDAVVTMDPGAASWSSIERPRGCSAIRATTSSVRTWPS